MPINYQDFLRTRRSIRRFDSKDVDQEILNRILETATYAPSAHNRQPWRFAVLTQPEPKSRLSDLLSADFQRDLTADGLPEAEIDAQLQRSRNRISSAPVIIILCMDISEMDAYPDEKRSRAERTMAVQSVAAAGLQIQLAAHAEGLASVWVCWPLFSPEAVCAALDLPHSWEPQAMFFIGYAAKKANPKELKPIKAITRFVT